MSKPVVKLAYTDFWPEFDRETDYFTRIIRRHYTIEWSDHPDFLIYSVFGFNHLRHHCPRIFYTGEDTRPDFRDCDYAFSFEYSNHPQHCRLPFYARRIETINLSDAQPQDAAASLARKTRFCTFVYSDETGIRRNRFLKKLSRYKRVDSGGGYCNNVGGRVADKHAFLSEGKFTIAFEHTRQAGYTTEKLTDALLAHTLPIYWGNPLIGREFNTKRFINAHEFASEEDLIERIIELDQDDALCLDVMRQPLFPDGAAGNPFVCEDRILEEFDRIFSTRIIPVSHRRRRLHLWDCSVRPLMRRASDRFYKQRRVIRNWCECMRPNWLRRSGL